ncbi:hypothetical protein GCM10008098_11930 [Rhodanobacter panaciterrae]|uniref:Uncharacterized protein n=1 Tax=Rhodanobacter panaciterrae TaxID=490572 RepID=A0ABQ2ZPD1_9GAMM|nr:hypothetical protein [Rhodanobacter panaciterrae]GGY20878.1 hypothetical protein GCM10008098_11930 [Rhodanobacter panaciterrae]
MPDQQLPPCGIGGASVSGGPCSGTYTASQAGQDAFSQIDKAPVVSTLLSAGVIVAGVLFVLFMVRKVAGFFGGAPVYVGGEPGTMEYDDNFWAARGREANASVPDVEFSDDVSEADAEDDSQLDYDGDQRLLDAPDLEEKQGADMTDEEYDAMEWREEYRREHEGDA